MLCFNHDENLEKQITLLKFQIVLVGFVSFNILFL